MSFVIASISVYSFDGDHRTVEFNRTGLNIITGKSRTGKSSLIDIIDYCFGRSDCYVAEGFIRRNVSWFGVELEHNDDRLFIARRNPGPAQNTSPDIFIRRGLFDELPVYTELTKNIAEEGLIPLLSQFAGIAENEHRPITGTRLPLQATIRHAFFLCVQDQDDIDSRDRLFHRQGDPFIPQAIKDTLPYFLGAVDEDHFIRQAELDVAKNELRALENKKQSSEEASRNNLSRLRRFVNDAKSVGLLNPAFEPLDFSESIDALQRVVAQDISTPEVISDYSTTILRLQDEQRSLRERLGNVSEEIRGTQLFISEQTEFSREASEHHSRLTSLELYRADDDGTHCPLCESKMSTPSPNAEALRAALANVARSLDHVGADSPHLQSQLVSLTSLRSELEANLVENQRNLEQAYREDERARSRREMIVDRARVLGRIAAFLEQYEVDPNSVSLEEQIEIARLRVKALEAEVDADNIGQRLDTFLNLISRQMSKYASRLDLEHGSESVRFDIKKLTVVADTATGPIPLNRMGSAENWVNYHVLTHLALHHWYRSQRRPVPSFLIFDQPSQAHYPPDLDQKEDGSLDPLQDADRRAVSDLFRLMKDASDEIGNGFQCIVLDHARLSDDWFQAAIIEEWRGGNALVPSNWGE